MRGGRIVQQEAGRDVLALELDLGLLEVREVEQVLHRAVEPLDMPAGLGDELLAVARATLGEQLERAADHGERGAELVADRREEFILQLVGRPERLGLARLGEQPIVLEHLRDEAGDGLGQADVVGAECIGKGARQREDRDGAAAHPQRHQDDRTSLLGRPDGHVARIGEEVAHEERRVARHRRAEQPLAEPEPWRRVCLRDRARGQAVERPVLAELLVRDEHRRPIEAQHVAARAKDGGHDRVGRRDARDDPHHLLERGILGDAPLQSGDEALALIAKLPQLAETAIEQERGQAEHRDDEDRALGRCREAECGGPERRDAEIAECRDPRRGPRSDGAEPERAGDDDDHRDEIGHPPRVAREEEHRDDEDGEIAGVRDRGDRALLLQ